jgi:maleylacetoacetate isomerase
MKEVPCIEIDGHLLTQSIPIIEYLDETRPGAALLPKDPYQRATARRIAEMINSGIQPVQNLRVLLKVMNKEKGAENRTKAKVEWGQWAINHGFEAVEKTLQCTAGKCCVGDTVTIADLCLVPQVYNANRFKVDMSQFPIISRVQKYLASLPAFEQAHPSKQPDAN